MSRLSKSETEGASFYFPWAWLHRDRKTTAGLTRKGAETRRDWQDVDGDRKMMEIAIASRQDKIRMIRY